MIELHVNENSIFMRIACFFCMLLFSFISILLSVIFQITGLHFISQVEMVCLIDSLKAHTIQAQVLC